MKKKSDNNKILKKNLIFLKSSVIALGLIFLVLVALLIIMQINKGKKASLGKYDKKISANYCNDKKRAIIIPNQIDQIIDAKNHLILLTKVKNNKQELITLDKKCSVIMNRRTITIKSK
jgi:hypothetical protein